MSYERKISTFIKSQFPQFYEDEGPQFIAFVTAYYEWMEQETGVIGIARTLSDTLDVDATVDTFLAHYQSTYLSGVPASIKGDKRFLVKHILDIYRSKGSIQGYKLLFRLLYNEDVDIYLPSDDIFRASDGTWYQPTYLEVVYPDEVQGFVGKIIKGSSSMATAVVENYVRQPVNGKIVHILYLSNVFGSFAARERITLQEDFNLADKLLTAPMILGSVTDVQILQGGQGFKVGDTLVSINGTGVEAEARVSAVANGTGTLLFDVVNGGTLFSLDATPIITRVQDTNGNIVGTGADFSVGTLTNLTELTYCTDLMIGHEDQVISPAAVANLVIANTATSGYVNGHFATFTAQSHIETYQFVNRGHGYANNETISFSGEVSATGFIVTDEIGAIQAIDFDTLGVNFATANVPGVITTRFGAGANVVGLAVTSGSGANAYVVTYANGSLSEVRLTAGGTGYRAPPKVSLPDGTGAAVTALIVDDYQFSNNFPSNTFNTFAERLHYNTKFFGTISSLGDIQTGNNYNMSPVVQVRDLLSTDAFPGNVFYSNTSPVITGSNTQFTKYFQAGSYVCLTQDPDARLHVDHRVIKAVANDTSMTLDDLPQYTSNGNILGVIINSSGNKYSNNDTVTVTGTGVGAVVKIVTNDTGLIVSTKLVNAGSGYTTQPVFTINSANGTGGSLSAVLGGAEYRLEVDLIKAQFAVEDSPTSLVAPDGSIAGANETITANPAFGTGIIKTVQVKNSGFGYTEGERIEFATFGALDSITIGNGGSGYSNNDVLVFAGGSAVSQASGIITTNANGSIVATTITFAGSGYKTNPTLSVQSRTGSGGMLNAHIGGLNTQYLVSGIAFKDGRGTSRGNWTTNRGFVSSNKYVQDSYYYQEYSYEVQAPIALSRYADVLKKTFHVAGTEMFGKVVLKEAIDSTMSVVEQSVVSGPEDFNSTDYTSIDVVGTPPLFILF